LDAREIAPVLVVLVPCGGIVVGLKSRGCSTVYKCNYSSSVGGDCILPAVGVTTDIAGTAQRYCRVLYRSCPLPVTSGEVRWVDLMQVNAVVNSRYM